MGGNRRMGNDDGDSQHQSFDIYDFLDLKRIGGVNDVTPQTLSNGRSTPRVLGQKEFTDQQQTGSRTFW